MTTLLGHVEALYRYPIKSMRGEALAAAELGWHGLAGDRRLALRRLDDAGGFPWLSATRLPELLLFEPCRRGPTGSAGDAPTHVRTPQGAELPALGGELAAEVARRHGGPLEMMQLRQGVFDDATVSVIATDTVREITRLAGLGPDARRFRPNVVVRLQQPVPFGEGAWLGGALSFGEGGAAPAVAVTQPDVRCAMINLDPDTARSTPGMLKAVVRVNQNHAGVYGTVTRTGRLAVGQAVCLSTVGRTA